MYPALVSIKYSRFVWLALVTLCAGLLSALIAIEPFAVTSSSARVMQRVPRVRADVTLHGFQAWTEAVGASVEPAPDTLQISTEDDAQQPRHAGGERSESAGSMAEEESRILSTLFALNLGRQTWSWGAIDVPWPLSRVAQPDPIPIASPA